MNFHLPIIYAPFINGGNSEICVRGVRTFVNGLSSVRKDSHHRSVIVADVSRQCGIRFKRIRGREGILWKTNQSGRHGSISTLS